MPHLTPISSTETPALLALRRTLWQLAFVGVATAATLARMAPQLHLLALWCVLLPSIALVVYFRHALLDATPMRRSTHAEPAGAIRRQRPQARRARSGAASGKRRPARVQQTAFRIDPRAG
jgi:hypothetical protein